MTQTSTEFRSENLFWFYARQAAFWTPVIIGAVHQLLMLIGRIINAPNRFDEIPVFVDPPGQIEPFVTLEYQWWLVLVVISAILCYLILSRRLATMPKRAATPFYVYLLFLLILVKPL
jgi:predicted small integral membrane protein